MKRIVINRSYDEFCISHQALIRLRELGQREALEEEDSGAYWPAAAEPRESAILNQSEKREPEEMLNQSTPSGSGRTWRRLIAVATVPTTEPSTPT